MHGLQVLGGSGVHGRPGVGGLGYAGHQGLEDGTLIGGGVGGQPIGGVGSAGLAPGLKNPSLVGAGVGDGLVGGGLVGGVSPGAVGGGLGLGGPVVHTQSEILPYDVTGGVGVVDKFIDGKKCKCVSSVSVSNGFLHSAVQMSATSVRSATSVCISRCRLISAKSSITTQEKPFRPSSTSL